jgi:hypothetical protein
MTKRSLLATEESARCTQRNTDTQVLLTNSHNNRVHITVEAENSRAQRGWRSVIKRVFVVTALLQVAPTHSERQLPAPKEAAATACVCITSCAGPAHIPSLPGGEDRTCKQDDESWDTPTTQTGGPRTAWTR